MIGEIAQNIVGVIVVSTMSYVANKSCQMIGDKNSDRPFIVLVNGHEEPCSPLDDLQWGFDV